MEKLEQPQHKVTVLEVLRMVWQADHYPCLGNGDIDVAIGLEREALERAGQAVSEPNDPPGLRHCLTALLQPGLTSNDRDDVLTFLDNLFDPEYRW